MTEDTMHALIYDALCNELERLDEQIRKAHSTTGYDGISPYLIERRDTIRYLVTERGKKPIARFVQMRNSGIPNGPTECDDIWVCWCCALAVQNNCPGKSDADAVCQALAIIGKRTWRVVEYGNAVIIQSPAGTRYALEYIPPRPKMTPIGP